MKLIKKILRLAAALLLLGMISSLGRAQQQTEGDTNPKPAARANPVLINDINTDDQASQTTLTPDQTSLTGAVVPTLGAPEVQHSYWVPGLSLQNVFQSPINGTGSWISSSYLNGDLSLSLSSVHSQLGVDYTGGGYVTNSSTMPSDYFNNLSLFESVHWGRWKLLFMDQFSYLPQSSFGFGGTSGIDVPGVGGSLGAGFPGLQVSYTPNQSLFSSNGTRVNNAAIAQAEYALTPRASLTAVGSYGILDFLQGNAINTDDAIFSLGYDYQISRADTLGLLYRFMGYRYEGNPQALNDHSINLAYGRKITGRLAFQLYGGPEVRTYRQPILGATETVSYSAGGLVTYSYERSNLSFSYNHGLSGGSGVLIGSVMDQVNARFAYQLTRMWQASTMVGYSKNGTVGGTPLYGSSQSFHSVFSSAGISRPLGRTANLSVSYTFNYQNLNQPVCPMGGCGQNYTQHQIWIGFQWHARPYVIR